MHFARHCRTMGAVNASPTVDRETPYRRDPPGTVVHFRAGRTSVWSACRLNDVNDRNLSIDFGRHTAMWSTDIACMNAIPRKSPARVLAE